jgi:hypothetical protein
MQQKRGLYVKDAGEENFELGRKFMDSPGSFAAAHGLEADQLECPDLSHAALDRARALGKDVESAGIRPDAGSMEKLHEIAAKHFGPDYEVALIPFGLKFREKLGSEALDITATATGTVTFLDTDADVDG